MARIEHQVEISQPPERVFDYVTSLERWPEWARRVVTVKEQSTSPLREGTTFKIVNKLLGRAVETPYIITAYEPNRRVIFKSTSGPVDAEFTFVVEPTPGGARFTETVDIKPGGVFRLAERYLASLSDRQLVENHTWLKKVLEA
jgi:uncharacterized protein YndB with AHSA1/START domain